MFSLSGNLKTLDGTFELDPTGAQIGEITPLGQSPENRDGMAARGRDRKADLSAPVIMARRGSSGTGGGAC
jgi:hypothetical protein